MKIALLWKNDFPWDVRIEKIAYALRDAGHQIFILCANTKRLARHEIIDGVKIRRLPFIRCSLLSTLISLPFHFNPFWLWMATRVVRREGIELLILRDVPLTSVALTVKKWCGTKLILDMAENYPAMYDDRATKGGWKSVASWIVKNPVLIRLLERQAVKKSEHVFVVVEESAQRLISDGANPRKVAVISNTPELGQFSTYRVPPARPELTLVYAGLIQERGQDLVIRAMHKLRGDGIRTRFVVIGDGIFLPQLKALVQECQMEDAVTFLGWVDNKKIPQLISDSDIGVIPHKKNPHCDTTIPNKLFDYMACGRAVIVSDAVPMRRIVEEEQCGYVFPAGNVDELADVIRAAAADRVAVERKGRNGLHAVNRRYNWRHDVDHLVQIVDGIPRPANIATAVVS